MGGTTTYSRVGAAFDAFTTDDMLQDEFPVLDLEQVPPLAPEPPQKPPAAADPAYFAVHEAYVAIYDAMARERNRVQCLNANRRKRHNAILMKLGQTSNSIMPAGVRIKLEPEIEEQPPPMPPDAWVKLEVV